MRITRTVIGTLLILLALVGAANAWIINNRLAYLTFSGPVALPRVTLPAGTYIFERVDPDNRSDVIAVRSRDRSHTYLMGITHLIPRPAGMPQNRPILLGETSSGAPRVVAWFPEGDSFGHEFIY